MFGFSLAPDDGFRIARFEQKLVGFCTEANMDRFRDKQIGSRHKSAPVAAGHWTQSKSAKIASARIQPFLGQSETSGFQVVMQSANSVNGPIPFVTGSYAVMPCGLFVEKVD